MIDQKVAKGTVKKNESKQSLMMAQTIYFHRFSLLEADAA